MIYFFLYGFMRFLFFLFEGNKGFWGRGLFFLWVLEFECLFIFSVLELKEFDKFDNLDVEVDEGWVGV